jgi:hypothetical protein
MGNYLRYWSADTSVRPRRMGRIGCADSYAYDNHVSASLIDDILYLPSCHLYLSICHRALKSRPEVCAVGGRPLSRLGGQPGPPGVSPAAEEIILRCIGVFTEACQE